MGDIAAALEYKQQSDDFMEKAWHYLAADDLHQACEKGWGAASHMAKAVAEVYDLEYTKHVHFNHVLQQAAQLANYSAMRQLRATANELHTSFYELKSQLDREMIVENLTDVKTLREALGPLVEARLNE